MFYHRCYGSLDLSHFCRLHLQSLRGEKANEDAILSSANALLRRYTSWCSWQHSTYCTLFGVNLAPGADATIDNVDTILLGFPAALHKSKELANDAQLATLLDLEHKLRVAQANDDLKKLRHFIALRSVLNWRRDKVTGQIQGTRSHQAIERASVQVNRYYERFNYTFARLRATELPLPDAFRKLQHNDLRNLDKQGPTLGSSGIHVSWIWGRSSTESLLGGNASDAQLESWADEGKQTDWKLYFMS